MHTCIWRRSVTRLQIEQPCLTWPSLSGSSVNMSICCTLENHMSIWFSKVLFLYLLILSFYLLFIWFMINDDWWVFVLSRYGFPHRFPWKMGLVEPDRTVTFLTVIKSFVSLFIFSANVLWIYRKNLNLFQHSLCCSRFKNLVSVDSPYSMPRRHSNMSHRLAGGWQPLSLTALMEYKEDMNAMGNGEFNHGSAPRWSIETAH